jgi:acyl-CoA thioester hydrolase
MGVLHNAAYAVYFEQARIDMCQLAGHPYSEWERTGYFLMVAELTIRYKAPCRLADPLAIEVGLARLKGRYVEFHYQIVNRLTRVQHAQGLSKHLLTGADGAALSFPAQLKAKLQSLMTLEGNQGEAK